MKDNLLEKAEQIVKPLKWGYPKTPNAGFICIAKTLFAEYEVQKDGSKFKVKYTNTAEGEPAKDATGWLTEEDAKHWAYTNHCKKVAPLLNLELLDLISIDERLPDVSGRYLVSKDVIGKNEFDVASFHTEKQYFFTPGIVTHWMPLPPPPIEVPNDI